MEQKIIGRYVESGLPSVITTHLLDSASLHPLSRGGIDSVDRR
jgi:hypothetical protein